MNDFIINCKEIEYTGRLALALHRNELEKARRLALTMLVIFRLQSRRAHAKEQPKWDEIRGLKRSIAELAAKGVTVSLAEPRLKKLQEERETAEKELASIGERIVSTLDVWQSVGADFEELCSLCNRNPAQVLEEIGGEEVDISFSKLATIYNLDYKNPRDHGWLDDCIDAPLTHALKAYMLDIMLHTEEGRKAAHEAMNAVFPEIMENAITVVTDEDGVQHLLDKDGNEICVFGTEGDEDA